MSMSQQAVALEDMGYWIEKLAKQRAEVEERINAGKWNAGLTPTTMSIVKYKTTNVNGQNILQVDTPEYGIPVLNQNVESVNKRTSGLGNIGDRIPISRTDFRKYQEAEQIYSVLLSLIPPHRMPAIGARMNTMRSLIASMSTTEKTNPTWELATTPVTAFPPGLGGTPQGQPQQTPMGFGVKRE